MNSTHIKEWVCLTSEEVEECKFRSVNGTVWSLDVDLDQFAEEIQRMLKEKNT